MTRRVVVSYNLADARALERAVEATVDEEEALETVFPTPQDKRRARRVLARLTAAIARAGRKEPGR